MFRYTAQEKLRAMKTREPTEARRVLERAGGTVRTVRDLEWAFEQALPRHRPRHRSSNATAGGMIYAMTNCCTEKQTFLDDHLALAALEARAST